LKYDVIVIGGGPGGYVAAIKAAQLGAKVAVVEDGNLGGVCLNWGCIPTKTLLRTAKLFKDMKNSQEFGITGIKDTDVNVDWDKMIARKNDVVGKLVSGIGMLFKKNKIDLYDGWGTVKSKTEVEVNGETITGKNLIIATGATENMPSIPGLEETIKTGKVLNSKKTFELEEIPKDLIVIGGGVIAVEFATLFNAIGSNVTLIQRSKQILSGTEKEMGRTLQRQLKKDGINVITGTSLKSITEDEVVIEHKGKEKKFTGDKYLVSLGLSANLSGLEALDLELDKKGFVKTDDHLKTNVDGVYAIGDLNGKFALAHVASAEGIVAAENIMGEDTSIDYGIIPSGIYTFPELASVGMTEEEAKEKGHDVKVSKFPLTANGKALAEGETTGFAKIISDNKYGEVLGVHIMASHATDMISEAVVAMQLEGTVHDIAKAIHPHPTTSEIVMEAAHAAVDQAIHM
jgi:dihydrolipoyl dehydrogenase